MFKGEFIRKCACILEGVQWLWGCVGGFSRVEGAVWRVLMDVG